MNPNCSRCGKPRDGKSTRCKPCRKALYEKGKKGKSGYIKKGVQYQKRTRRYYRVLAIYKLGNKCNKCGNSNPKCLELDHVNGDGVKDRGVKGTDKQRAMYIAVIKGQRTDIQLLCANCHREKTWNELGFYADQEPEEVLKYALEKFGKLYNLQ